MKKDVNKKLQQAFNKIETPDVLQSVLKDVETQKDFVTFESPRRSWNKLLAYSLAFVLLIAGLGFGFFYQQNSSITTIAFDVNPSIEIEINKEEKITKVNAVNEDAQIILENMELEGIQLDVGVNALIGSMVKHGYLNELTNSILVSVDSNNQDTVNYLQEKLMNEIVQFIQSNQLEGSVITQKIDSNNQDIEQLSQEYGITKAKAQLIQEILDANTTHTFDELVDCSIHELNLISESKQEIMSNISTSGSASEAKYIGKDKAIEIALNHLGLTQSMISNLEIEFDYEMSTMVYEIEFEYNYQEYELDIDAVNGNILHSEKDVESSDNNSNVSTMNVIGKDKAKEIVLSHAQVSESQIRDYWIELDQDDNQLVYEIDFKVNNVEYEFEINAESGQIIKFEKEVDD